MGPENRSVIQITGLRLEINNEQGDVFNSERITFEPTSSCLGCKGNQCRLSAVEIISIMAKYGLSIQNSPEDLNQQLSNGTKCLKVRPNDLKS